MVNQLLVTLHGPSNFYISVANNVEKYIYSQISSPGILYSVNSRKKAHFKVIWPHPKLSVTMVFTKEL